MAYKYSVCRKLMEVGVGRGDWVEEKKKEERKKEEVVKRSIKTFVLYTRKKKQQGKKEKINFLLMARHTNTLIPCEDRKKMVKSKLGVSPLFMSLSTYHKKDPYYTNITNTLHCFNNIQYLLLV